MESSTLSNRRPLFGAVLISLTLCLAVLAACGDSDGDESAFTPVKGTESAYCDTFRAWQVHHVLDGGDEAELTPAAFERYWNEYLVYQKTSVQQAPQVIRDEWVASERGVRTIPTPVLEKYDFDVKRIERDGTAAEKGWGEPPPDLEKAQAAIHAYDARTCGTEGPPAADVAFKANGSSEAYCKALGTFNNRLEQIASSQFDPDVMQTAVTADSFSANLDALDESAPVEIAADVKAVGEWLRTRWSDVIAESDYDLRRIWLDGTPEDRAVFHLSHPDIVKHDTRLTAYEEQVCAEIERAEAT